MQSLELYILRGELDYMESNPDEVKQVVNRAIYSGDQKEHKTHPIQFVSECIASHHISESMGLGMISLLIELGAYVNGYGTWKEDSPLLAAIGLYQTEIAHFLIDKGADYAHLGYHGATALHWAAWTGQDTLVEALLEFPVDIDVPDHDFGATPLLYGIHGYFRGGDANNRNQIQCIKLLLEAGANPRHKDKEGNDAWAYLKGRDGKEILELLES